MAAAFCCQQPRLRHHRHWLHRGSPPLGVSGQSPESGTQGLAEECSGASPRPQLRSHAAMPAREITIINKLGLHARAAAKFVGVASTYPCQVRIGRSADSLVDGKSIMAAMIVAAGQGSTVHLLTGGEQDAQAMTALVGLIENYCDEGE